MDIREWLQNTGDREPPDEDENHGFPDFLCPPPRQAEHPWRKQERKRRRSPSEQPPPAGHGNHRHAKRRYHRTAPSEDSEQWRPNERTATSSEGSIGSGSADHDERRHSKSYERQPRRKTRSDRYEANRKKPHRERRLCKEKESRSQKCKSDRRDGSRTVGPVQSFQSGGLPRTSRLTLRPDLKSGIFKHGRSSAQMVGNGPGLPDLVFNEMKFLQRPKEHQDELPRGDESSRQRTKKTKKTKKQRQDEEISAYFSKKSPVPPTQPERKQDPPLAAEDLQFAVETSVRRKSESLRAPRPPVELPERAFLGFGGRGPSHDNQELQTSNTYCTWSESLPPRQSPISWEPVQPATGHISRTTDHHSTSQRSQVSTPRRKVAQKRVKSLEVPPHGGTVDRSPTAKRQRVKLLTLGEISQPSMNQSMPRAQCDAVSEDPVANSPRYGDNNELSSEPNFPTSDILKVRGKSGGRSPSPSVTEQNTKCVVGTDKENVRPPASTPTSQLLRRAFLALDQQQRQPSIEEYPEDLEHIYPMKEQADVNRPQAYQEPIEPLLAEVDLSNPQITRSETPEGIPLRGFGRSIDASRSAFQSTFRPSVHRPGQHHPRPLWNMPLMFYHDEAPDHYRPARPMPMSQKYVANTSHTEELARRLIQGQVPAICQVPRVDGELQSVGTQEPQCDLSEYQDDAAAESEMFLSVNGSFYFDRALPVSERPGLHDEEEEANPMPGFWRPNILY